MANVKNTLSWVAFVIWVLCNLFLACYVNCEMTFLINDSVIKIKMEGEAAAQGPDELDRCFTGACVRTKPEMSVSGWTQGTVAILSMKAKAT